jgi:hypothetical protein
MIKDAFGDQGTLLKKCSLDPPKTFWLFKIFCGESTTMGIDSCEPQLSDSRDGPQGPSGAALAEGLAAGGNR